MSERDRPGQIFADLGFHFVHRFLWCVLAACALLTAAGLWLAWTLEGDVTVRAEGVVRPRARRLVKVRVAGVVERIYVRAGAVVAQGDTLAVVASRATRQALHAAESKLELSAATLAAQGAARDGEGRVLRDVLQARQLDADEAEAFLEGVRVEQRLYSERALAHWRRQPLDQLIPVRAAASALARARAAVAVARQQVAAHDARSGELDVERARWRRLQEERAEWAARLARCVVHAPADGVVLTQDLGRRVGDRVEVGAALLELAAGGGWRARVAVTQHERPRLAAGQRARVFVEAYPHLEHGSLSGTVRAVALQATPETRRFRADIDLDSTHLVLADGMRAEVRVRIESGRLLALVWRRLLESLGGGSWPGVREAQS